MTVNELLDLIGNAKDPYVLSAVNTREGVDQPRKIRIGRKPLLIAAIIALALLLVGCAAAVVVLNLKDMKLGEYRYTEPAHFDENGQKVEASEGNRNVISLQGVKGSPNYQAAQEWLEFDQAYDPDWTILADSDDFQRPEDYEAYSVYSQEMLNKVDEIAAKYGLQLLGPAAVFQRYESDVFFESLGIDSLFLPQAQTKAEGIVGYFYQGGNFKAEFWQSMTGEGQWPYEMLNSMYFSGKDYLDTVYSTLGELTDYEEWNYTTAQGYELLIVQGGRFARIFCDREDAFVSVSIDICYEQDDGKTVNMTRQQLLQVVETFDFGITPQKTDLSLAKEKLEKFNPELFEQRQAAMMETYVDPYTHGSYLELIKSLISESTPAEEMTYAMADVNGDGVEELLLGYTGRFDKDDDAHSFIEVFTIQNGQTSYFFSTSHPTYLCEDDFLECVDFQGAEKHWYYLLGKDYDETRLPEKYQFVGYSELDGTWETNKNDTDITPVPITEEEARQLIESHPRIPLEMKPITEFPGY